MPSKGPDKAKGTRAQRFGRSVGNKAARKAHARKGEDESVWNWFGMMGLIGWSVSVPTVVGALAGRWLDARWPGQVSWTLTMLIAGMALGCFSAWYWMTREGGRK